MSSPQAETPSAGKARSGLDRKRVAVLAVVEVAVLVVIVTRVMPQVGSYSAAADALGRMTPASLVLIGLAVAGYLVWYGLPMMAAAPGLGFARAQQLNQAGFAIGNGVPGGGAFGAGVQYAMFASWGYPAVAGTAAIAAVGVWSLFVTLGLPVFGVLALVASGRAAGGYVVGALAGVVALVVVVAGFALVMRSEAVAVRLGDATDALARRLPRRLAARVPPVAPALLSFRTGITGLVRRRWVAITVTQVGVGVTQFLCLFVSLRALEGWGSPGTPLLVAFAGFAVSQLGLMLPITPGGLGTVDAAMVAMLVGFGTGPGAATAAALVWRATSFVPQVVLGVLALMLWTRSANRLVQGRTPRT